MAQSADTINTRSTNGMNLTPRPAIASAQRVMGPIDLDPASCYEAQQIIRAKQYYTLEFSGLSEKWVANTLWLNPPGRSMDNRNRITAADWARKLARSHAEGTVQSSIYLAYRGGSLGSLGLLLAGASRICLTTNQGKSKAINGSGRLSYDTINPATGLRVPETSNTQSSAFILTTKDPGMIMRFESEFKHYGIVLKGVPG